MTLARRYENASPTTPLLVGTGQPGKEDEGTQDSCFVFSSRDEWTCSTVRCSEGLFIITVLV